MYGRPTSERPPFFGGWAAKNALASFCRHVVYQQSHEVGGTYTRDIAGHVEDGRVLYETQRKKELIAYIGPQTILITYRRRWGFT